MTPRDFCLWLSGFVDYHLDNSVIPTAATMDKITAKLDAVLLDEKPAPVAGREAVREREQLKTEEVNEAYDLLLGMFPDDEQPTDPAINTDEPDTDPWLHIPLTEEEIEEVEKFEADHSYF